MNNKIFDRNILVNLSMEADRELLYYFYNYISKVREKIVARWRRGIVYINELDYLEALVVGRVIIIDGKRFLIKGFVMKSKEKVPIHSYPFYHSYSVYKLILLDEYGTKVDLIMRVVEEHVFGEYCNEECYRVKFLGDDMIWKEILTLASDEMERKKDWMLTDKDVIRYIKWLEENLKKRFK
jgi:hypothetical protein